MRIAREDKPARESSLLNKRLTRIRKTARMQRRLALAVLVAALGIGVAAPAATAAAAKKKPCYKRVIDDWSRDGIINGHYSARCLRKAIKKTPEDLRDYSGIIDDINAALVATGAGGKNGGGPSGGRSGARGPGGGPAIPGTSPESVQAAKEAVPKAGTPGSDPGHDRSFPLPLILLGAIVLVGALAGAAPALIKRFRARFPRLRPTPGSVRPPA
jgi:hypothetical protein